LLLEQLDVDPWSGLSGIVEACDDPLLGHFLGENGYGQKHDANDECCANSTNGHFQFSCSKYASTANRHR
jgi:hypothetical protein